MSYRTEELAVSEAVQLSDVFNNTFSCGWLSALERSGVEIYSALAPCAIFYIKILQSTYKAKAGLCYLFRPAKKIVQHIYDFLYYRVDSIQTRTETLHSVLSKWYGTTQYHGARPASPCCWLPVSLCCLHLAGHGVGVC
jgi:hypothetical protein